MAATIIDTLVVELGLDPAKFSSGQQSALLMLRTLQQQSETGVKQIEAQTHKIGNIITSLRREAIGAFGLLFGGYEIKKFVEYVTQLDASAGRFGRTLGSSADDVSAFRGAIEQVGGTAQSADATLASINQEIVRFSITGQTSALPVLNQLGVSLQDQNGKWKTALELYQDVADAIERQHVDPRRAAGLLGLLGISPDGINLMLKGGSAVRDYIRAAREAAPVTKEAADAAEKYQKDLALLERSATGLGRTLVSALTPALSAVFDAMTKFINGPGAEAKAKSDFQLFRDTGQAPEEPGFLEKMGSALTGLPAARNKKQYRYERGRGFVTDDAGAAPPPAPSGGVAPSLSQMENLIRRYAVLNGIDPNQALAVARNEGLHGYVGDRGSSFGPFQLHYGGIAPGMLQGGLGDVFTKRTGLDARDPSTTEAQVKFALEWAREHGWSDWRGWRGSQWAGINRGASPGFGARSVAAARAGSTTDNSRTSSTKVDVGAINITAPAANDAAGVSKEIGRALDRELTAASANAGAL